MAQHCGHHCTTCADPHHCTACVTGYIFGQEGACVCRVGHFDNGVNCPQCPALCLSCSSSSVCTACVSGYYLNGIGMCQACSSCAPGQFVATACTSTSNTVCGGCDSSCSTCSGPNAADCTSCPAGDFLMDGNCYACSLCGGNTFQTAACTATSDTQCAACDHSCLTCNAAGPTSCTSCADFSYVANSHYYMKDYFLADGSCFQCSNCPTGQYASVACTPTVDTQCAACDSTCATCIGPSAAPDCN